MKQILFFIILFLLVYPWIFYPLILIFVSCFFGKKIEKEDVFPSVTLIIPAYNEEKVIEEKIRNSLSLDYPQGRLEIILSSESDDNTNVIASKYVSKNFKLIVHSQRRGKQSQIYRVLPQAKGEIVVLTDANSIFRRDAIKKLVRSFADSRVGCVSGQLNYKKKGEKEAGGEGAYWRYEVWLKQLESRFFAVLGVNGSIYAIRKELYFPMSENRGDDFELPIKIRQKGYGVVWEPEAVSYEEPSASLKEEFKRKVRIIAWNWQSSFMLLKGSSPFLIFQLVSHKILRWLVGFLLIAFFIVSFLLKSNPFFWFLWLEQLIFYLAALVICFSNRGKKMAKGIEHLIYYFCFMALAAIVGVGRGIFIRQSPIWEKAR